MPNQQKAERAEIRDESIQLFLRPKQGYPLRVNTSLLKSNELNLTLGQKLGQYVIFALHNGPVLLFIRVHIFPLLSSFLFRMFLIDFNLV